MKPTTNIVAGVIELQIYRLGTVIVGGNTEIQEVQQNEILYIENSPLAAPTQIRPVYIRTGELSVDIRPTTITGVITCTYIKKPIYAKLGIFCRW